MKQADYIRTKIQLLSERHLREGHFYELGHNIKSWILLSQIESETRTVFNLNNVSAARINDLQRDIVNTS